MVEAEWMPSHLNSAEATERGYTQAQYRANARVDYLASCDAGKCQVPATTSNQLSAIDTLARLIWDRLIAVTFDCVEQKTKEEGKQQRGTRPKFHVQPSCRQPCPRLRILRSSARPKGASIAAPAVSHPPSHASLNGYLRLAL